MAGYVIFDLEVHDPGTYAAYRDACVPSVRSQGGRVLVHAAAACVLHGAWRPHRLAVVAFEGLSEARRWYHSAAYRDARPLRERSARARAVLVGGMDGFGPPPAGAAGYVIADLEVHNPARFAEFREVGVPTIARHGGRLLTGRDDAQPLEGGWRPGRLALLRFADLAAARRWHASGDYQAARRILLDAARPHAVAVQGG